MIPEDIKSSTDNLQRYRERISNFSKDFEVGLFIYLLRKSTIYFILVFITIFILAFLYLRYTPYTYEASSTLQINIKDQADEILDIYSFQQQTNINSEVELIKSQIIIDKTIAPTPIIHGSHTPIIIKRKTASSIPKAIIIIIVIA